MSAPDQLHSTKLVDADGVSVFYREAGNPFAPALLLLHGFPSSSFHYRKLLDSSLANTYRFIAPDLPGFGFTEVPDERAYEYTFDNLATTIGAFVDALGLKKFSLYIFDYGAPVGLRLASARPEAVSAIISQNGNAFVEGLGPVWDKVKPLWKDNSAETRAQFNFLVPSDVSAFKAKYTTGEAEPGRIPPEVYTLDHALLNRAGQMEVQLDLWHDYGRNIELYPVWQEYMRKYQPPVLAIWGKNDPIFIPAGAEAFKSVVPEAEVVLLDAGHFAIENHAAVIVGHIEAFLAKNGI